MASSDQLFSCREHRDTTTEHGVGVQHALGAPSGGDSSEVLPVEGWTNQQSGLDQLTTQQSVLIVSGLPVVTYHRLCTSIYRIFARFIFICPHFGSQLFQYKPLANFFDVGNKCQVCVSGLFQLLLTDSNDEIPLLHVTTGDGYEGISD